MRSKRSRDCRASARFAAEAAYAESIFRSALGDTSASIAELKRALSIYPDYAPAILSMGSVEYQRQRRANGKRLLFSLLSLPDETEDLYKIIDEAGSFLIDVNEYAHGLELFRLAARRFPNIAEFQQGIGCCAGHEGFTDEALAASRRAIDLDTRNAAYVSDLGWSLLLAERYGEAEAMFQRALAMDPSYERAQANLQYCRDRMAERTASNSRSNGRAASGVPIQKSVRARRSPRR
jgi:tetratricopeptide (TPR) repeat protein